ncbi:MAG: hypothetical protein GF311_28240 [Candidatus Lokiarchaeota archaeon]|nr:hypothetical protein [Candidatus Lokiarchaeota archaeon]
MKYHLVDEFPGWTYRDIDQMLGWELADLVNRLNKDKERQKRKTQNCPLLKVN